MQRANTVSIAYLKLRVAWSLALCWVERILKKIDPRIAHSSFLLSLGLIMGYVAVGVLAGGSATILHDLSLPVFFVIFWLVIYLTARHCTLMRSLEGWLSEVSDKTRMTEERRKGLFAYFEGKAFGRSATIVGLSTYAVSLSYFLIFTLPRAHWRLTELPYCNGFALGIPLTSAPLLLASELLHWAPIRAVSTTAIWLALVSTLFLRQVSRDFPIRFATFDHWRMKPVVDSVWSISWLLGVAGIFIFVWLPFFAVFVLGRRSINMDLAVFAAIAYGVIALGMSVWVIVLARNTLASVKREVLSEVDNRLWRIYAFLEAHNKKKVSVLKELNVEVLTLEQVGASVEKKVVFPVSVESALGLLASPLVYSSLAILREYVRSAYGF